MERERNIEIPSFTADEVAGISKELSPTRWKEVGLKIPINEDWSLELTKDERDHFHIWKTNVQDISSLLIKTWRVRIDCGGSEDREWTGYRLVPNDSDIINPYDEAQESIDVELKKRYDWINDRRGEIKLLVDALLEEDRILEERRKKIQASKWDIPKDILAWKTVDEIWQQIENVL
jgi:hypothetical protein